ncbi:MAG: hypothetical protein ABEH80_07800 [Halobaculum sp.]
MSDVAALRDPNQGDFLQPFENGRIGVPSTDIFVGKRVLEGFFHTDSGSLGPEAKAKQKYSQFLLERIVGDELPFTTIHTTRETLNVAITSLGHGNGDRRGADNCLESVRESDAFRIHHCASATYDSVVSDFLKYEPREISIQEAVLANVAIAAEVTHVATWDSDFTRYDDTLVLYPRNYWE